MSVQTYVCKKCGFTFQVLGHGGPVVVLEPWPHIICPCCGKEIPLF